MNIDIEQLYTTEQLTMSLSGQTSNTTQEQILNVQEEIYLQLALLESIDDSVSNRQVLEIEIRERLRVLQLQYQNLKKNFNPTVPESASPITFHPNPADSASFNLSLETHTFDSGIPGGLNHPVFVNHQLVQTPHNRKRQYSEYSDSAALSPCHVAKFQRLSLDSLDIDQGTTFQRSPIYIDNVDKLENDCTDILVKQQKEIEERIQREILDEQYARKLQAEFQDTYSSNLSTHQSSHSRLPKSKQTVISETSQSSGNLSKSNDSLLEMQRPSVFSLSLWNKGESSTHKRNTAFIDLDDDLDVKSEITLNSSSTESDEEVEIVQPYNIPTGMKFCKNGFSRKIENSKFYTQDNLNDLNHQSSSSSTYQPNLSPMYHFKSNHNSLHTGFYNNSINDSLARDSYHLGLKNSEISDECKELAKNIRLDVETRREETPEGLVHPLYEHQKIALFWLKSKEESVIRGGILADDMGLGKTISALALIISRPSTTISRKTTLIVGPVALIRQWEREIRVKIKNRWRLSTVTVHGSSKKYGWDDISHYDVVLTTYGTLASEFRRLTKWKEAHPGQNFDESILKKNFPLVGPKSRFYRIILDEAQSIKNRNTVSAKACFHLNSTYRICLTGTPMMNNVAELYSVVLFLRVKPYNEWSRFNRDFGILSRSTKSESAIATAMKKFQALLKAILLRRTKNTLIDGKPIISLPPKVEEIHHVVFDDDESAFYNALESKTKIQFNKYLAAGSIGRNYSNILILLLRLRQACCHPHLIYDFDQAPPVESQLREDEMIELAKSLAPDVIERLLNCDGAFECPICYDGVENPRIIIPCGHDTCNECLVKISDQQALQRNSDHEMGQEAVSKCPSCRGPLILNKVIDYNSFKKVYNPEEEKNDETKKCDDEIESDSETQSDDGSETEDEDDGSLNGDLRNFIVSNPVNDQDIRNGEIKPKFSKKRDKGKGKSSQFFRSKSIPMDEKEKKPHLSLAMLKQEASKSAANRKRYMKYLKSRWQPSAKIIKCIELVRKFLDEGQKILIFSQFVSLLDLLQVPIEEEKWNFLRYDGSMSADLRHTAVEKFCDSTTHNLMLLSLKAGNAGLNLVAASRVIILDPFWNPFIEMQAVDRAHRIGQQNIVEIHRILIENTVEDRIVELQERKRRLVNMALDEGAARSLGRLNEAQLVFLFGGGPS
ncbi:putative swi snf family dna-dependent atpase [Erysiphe neolycopersici]|uniref:Putative swi snf family dna-dependent atpase n=1 Tax=Erysiphe neolycopersici TaxID=212602 RepID=A0A420HXV5_9PEZI|nr:putative swi snf family dna-dependent atpase [Erysiphe neolycopersici]